MKRFEGKVALVTGGNSGIGLSTAKRFYDEGAKVVITGRNQKTLDEAVKAIGKDVVAIKADVSKVAELDKVYTTVAEKFGKIDILFANAGVAKFLPVPAADEAHYDEQFDINTKGAYFTAQKALPYLSDGGSIIFNSSVVSAKGLPNGAVYAGTKAALRSFARSLAAAVAERGIRVNTVAPGPIETPIFGRTGMDDKAVSEFKQNIVQGIPLKRIGTPDEVAGAVAFLASKDASYITGVELNVDGGMGQI